MHTRTHICIGIAGLMAIHLAMKTNGAMHMYIHPHLMYICIGIAGLMAIHLSMKTNGAMLEVALDAVPPDARKYLLLTTYYLLLTTTYYLLPTARGRTRCRPAGRT